MDICLGMLLFRFQDRINRAKYWIAAVAFTSLLIVTVEFGLSLDFNALFFVLASIIFVALFYSLVT
jgi:uncharacterized membrane protein YhaH (DUF805 family)